MTFYYSRLLLLAVLFPLCLFCQRTEFLNQHELSLNYKPETRWSFNFEFTNRNTFPKSEEAYKVQHLELSHFTTYQSGFYGSFSLGLRYRNRDLFDTERSNEVRFTQQYNYVRSYNQYRIGHRFRLEERLYTGETAYRLRYRLGIDFPLQGLRLDTGEFYTAINLENVYSVQDREKPDFNQRLSLTLGNKISAATKLQIALEYRKDDYLLDESNRVFLYTSAKIDL